MKSNLQQFGSESCSGMSRITTQVTSRVHLFTVMFFLGVMVVAPSPRLQAQVVPVGQPVIQTSTSMQQNPSPVFVDATQFTGDTCDKIRSAIQALAVIQGVTSSYTYGVVDARGFVGAQICNTSMFPTSGTIPTGKLLLGNAVFYVSVTQVQPTKFQVEGTGWTYGVTGTSEVPGSNTVIRACTGTGNGCFSALGNHSTDNVVWCYGGGTGHGGCNGSDNPHDAAFGSLTQYMTFDCNGNNPGGNLPCTAMRAYDVQEGTGCWHCQFQGWGKGGKGLDVCNSIASCQNSSFQDLYFLIDSVNTTCTTTAVPIVVDSRGGTGPKFIKAVTVDAMNCPGTTNHPSNAFRFSSQQTSVENVFMQGTSIGLRVAGDSAVNSVTINGVHSGNMVGTPSHCTPNASDTTTILLDNLNNIYNATILSTGSNTTSGGVTNPAADVILDCHNKLVDPGNAGNEYAVAQYTIGPTGLPYFNTNILPTVVQSPPALVLDLNSSGVQQYACTTGSSVTFSTSNLQPGAAMTLIFVQPVTGTACSASFPSNMHGATAVSTGLGSVTTQQFLVSNAGTDLYAVAPASICLAGGLGTTCGAP